MEVTVLKDVAVMGEFVYDAVDKYFKVLSKLGYYSYKEVYKLLLLIFYYNLLYYDYRGYVSKEDYLLIERALNCLYGTNCLIPYPDYLKMGKLRLGDMVEMAQRVKTLENTEVLKAIHSAEDNENSDIMIVEED